MKASLSVTQIITSYKAPKIIEKYIRQGYKIIVDGKLASPSYEMKEKENEVVQVGFCYEYKKPKTIS